MDRCPNCRARTDDSDHCRRCGMDFSLLRATAQAALALQHQALAALARGDRAVAQAASSQSLALRSDEAGRRLADFASWLASRPPQSPPQTAEPAQPPSSTNEPAMGARRRTWLQRLFGRAGASPTSEKLSRP